MKHFIAATLLLSSALASAEYWDGHTLLRHMTSEDQKQRYAAIGYLLGVSDTTQNSEHCPPPGLTADKPFNAVLQWMQANGPELHRTADLIVLYVLRTNWPCKRT